MHRRIATLPPRWLLGLALCALSGASLPWPVPALAQLGPTSPAAYHTPSGYRAKEFTLVRKDGWFHLFYIRQNEWPGVPTEQSLGHAISRDLYTWTEQDTILPVLPGTYEGSQIWAPHLIRTGDTWRMFYPAMHDDPAHGIRMRQAITVAMSTDLVTWTRRDTPLFDNTLFPWAYHDTTSSLGSDCRDPFVWWDAPHGEWVMYVATRPADDPQNMVIGIATSTDLETWQDAGYVPISLAAYSFASVAESPTLFQGDPSLLLFLWTTNSGNSLTYGTSPDALAGWGGVTRLRTMLGYSTLGWWASESLLDGARRYFASVDDTWLQFWDLKWTAPYRFTLTPPDSSQILDAGFDRAAATVGDTAQVFARMVHGAGRALALRWVRTRGAIVDTLKGADFGLPDTLALGADSVAAPFAVTAPLLAGERSCFLGVSPREGTAPPATLRVDAADPPYEDPPPPPEAVPIAQRVRVILILRPAEVRFVKDGSPAAWRGEVFDVRGRRIWQGEAARGQRTLVWRPGGVGGGAGKAVGPGIYFARVQEEGRPPELVKVPLVAAP